MTRKERIVIWVAWHLPRSIAYWAYIRVATAGDKPGTPYPGNPTEQSVIDPINRWAA
jgi:hypothetical protein